MCRCKYSKIALDKFSVYEYNYNKIIIQPFTFAVNNKNKGEADQKSVCSVMKNVQMQVFVFDSRPASFPWLLCRPIHMQRFYYIKSGNGWYLDTNDIRHSFLPEHIYIIPYDMPCRFFHDESNPIDHIYIDFLTTPPILGGTPFCYTVKNNSAICKLLEAFEAMKSESSYPWRFHYSNCKKDNFVDVIKEDKTLIGHLLMLMLSLLDRVEPLMFVKDKCISDTVSYIHEHFGETLNNEILAKRAGFVKHYFISLFKSTMNVTPYAYLRFYRLTKAKELIRSGVPLRKAAELVGYENASSLSRALKQDNFEI